MANAYTVNFSDARALNILPASVTEEILQNIYTLLSTFKGNVPLNRSFGISGEVIDKPPAVAEVQLIGEIYDAVRKYEPRARVLIVDLRTSENGSRIIPTIKVEISDE